MVTGSQELYGEQVLLNVESHSREIAEYFDHEDGIPVRVKFTSVAKSPQEILSIVERANSTSQCIGLVLWMHTFSPAKMWINGLRVLNKPYLHLHTQYNDEIPWQEIDMDFMNENQSAHGDREFGFITSRLRKAGKVVVGHWKNPETTRQLGVWSRAAAGWHALRNMRVARIGDNMREVAVTEGDKVEAQIKWGLSVNGYGVGDLVEYVNAVNDADLNVLLEEYEEAYQISEEVRTGEALREAARIEVGLRKFLGEGGFQAFTTTFENLHGLKQLPGISVQRLMEAGYGFAAEGDWKTAALLYAIKVMSRGLKGGTSFMEDYTYDFKHGWVLGAHMLEICPSIASGKPRCEVHPLGIGGKADPARLVFDVAPGPAVNVSVIDMGTRFRMLVNEVKVIAPGHDLPNLPVARVLWEPMPDLPTAAQSWILAGGAHHTVFSMAVNSEFMEDFAEMAGMELVFIDGNTNVRSLKESLRWNEVYYHLFQHHL